jgi:superkiller protein 3
MLIRRVSFMAKHPHRPLKSPPEEGIQKEGLFTGTAQSGAARKQRAHALAEELLARGCLFIKKQVWDEAASEFRKALQMEANYPEALNNLGLCLLYLKKNDESIEALKQAVRLFPGWHIAEANLALSLAASGRHGEAAEHYEKSLTIKEQPAVWLSLGDVYVALGKLDQAKEAYEKALAGNPRSSIACQRLGALHARRGKFEECEAELRKAVELDPQNVEAWALLGAVAARKGQFTRARSCFDEAAHAEKLPPAAQRGAHRLEIFRAGLEKALAEWKGSVPEPPPLAVCCYNLGLAQLKAGNRTAAKDAFRQAAELNPGWPELLIWCASFEALDGNALAARKQLEAARELKPDDGRIQELLGYIGVAMGLQKEVEAHFAEAAKLGRTIPREHIFPDQPPAPAPAQAAEKAAPTPAAAPAQAEGSGAVAEQAAAGQEVCPIAPDEE